MHSFLLIGIAGIGRILCKRGSSGLKDLALVLKYPISVTNNKTF